MRKLRKHQRVGIAGLLLTIFAAELVITELLSPHLVRLKTVQAALLDASLLVIISLLPLWFLFVRPLSPHKAADAKPSPALLLAEALAGIFLVEYLVMLFMPQLYLFMGKAALLVDALLTTVAASFLIRRFLMGLQRRARRRPLLETSLRLYALLLCTLFLAALLTEVVLPQFFEGVLTEPSGLAEAILVTLCGAPFLWLLVVRPLKSEATSEKVRIAAVHAQLTDGIVALDADGIITSFNPAVERLFGCQADSIIGRSGALLLEEGEQGLEELLKGAAGAEREAPSRLREIHCRRSDGTGIIMNVSVSKVQLEDEGPDFLLIMRDITLRKEMERALLESETRFREIFHQSEDAIVFFKPGGCAAIDVNANAERIFGYSRSQLLEGGLALIAETEDLPALTQAVAGIGEGRGARHEFRCRRSDQAQIIVSMHGKTMVLQGVPVTHCTFRDITERIRAEEMTREIQAKLIQANKMTSLGLLVSGVAHEINNPNNYIMANAELLSRISHDSLKLLNEFRAERGEAGEIHIAGIPLSDLEEHWIRLLDGILDGSRRVNDIVKNLKAFARQERNQEKREVDLNRVARSAATLMHHELIKFTDNFHLELEENLPPVIGHSQQLGQVIINLLMNACQSLPDRKRGVWLATSYDSGRGEAVITVHDEGCGMTRDEGQRIMEQFFTTKLDSGGTGLGLSISKSIVKEHGGRLEFASEPGLGSTFYARIPAAPPSPQPAAATAAMRETPGA